MPRKTTPPRTKQEDWLGRLRESSHDVFLAGLASLARTRGSGGSKSVWTDFDALVAEGRTLEPDLRETVQKTWEEWRERSPIGALPLRTEGRLQGVFQERVAAAVRSLGLPTRAEFDAMNAKLDRLLEQRPAPGRARTAKVVAADDTPAAPASKVAARGKAGAKPAPRKAAVRKSPAR